MMMDTAMKFLGKGQGKDHAESNPSETIQLMNHLSKFVATSHQLMVDLKMRLIHQMIASNSQLQKEENECLDESIIRAKLLAIMKETLIQCCQVAPGQSKARAKLSRQYHQLKEKFSFSPEVKALSYCDNLSILQIPTPLELKLY